MFVPEQRHALRVLYSRREIAARVAELARQIDRDLAGESALLIGILKGAVIFLGDLARSLQSPVALDFVGTSSYAGTASSGEISMIKDVSHPVTGENIILIEDILDTGYTLDFLARRLASQQPRSLRIATFLDKPARRVVPVKVDYVGFAIGDEFVVGYGMDYNEQYRNLPDICALGAPLA